MAKPKQKIALSQSRDIPFNRLVLSQFNVRQVKAGVSIDELAQDIARRTLLQSLIVRPILDADSAETGMFESRRSRYSRDRMVANRRQLSRPCDEGPHSSGRARGEG
jgi:hypothetical protein